MIAKKIYIHSSKNQVPKKAILLFAGWGMDEHPFMKYRPKDADLIVVYDYRLLDFDEQIIAEYDEIKVIGWSMGVWAASQVLQNKNYPIIQSYAINGTLFPVDDTKGIPSKIFEGTLQNLNEKTLYKFRRRMCGTNAVFTHFITVLPDRNLTELKEELEKIGTQSKELALSDFPWDKIYISENDWIFPTENQQNAWKNAEQIVINESHYTPELFQRLLQ